MSHPTIDVILTRYRRRTTEVQIQSILQQSIKPSTMTVFQNSLHLRPRTRWLQRKGIENVVNSMNTRHFGRFAYALNLSSDFIAVLDDDVVPGPRCLESYLRQSIEFGAIVGGNGRIATRNPNAASLTKPREVGVRPEPHLVDFVGHVWVFPREALFDMFAIAPLTLETGEDMHLCFSAKLRSNIPAIAGSQASPDEFSDTTFNRMAKDRHASHLQPSHRRRPEIETYFEHLGLEFVQTNTPPTASPRRHDMQ